MVRVVCELQVEQDDQRVDLLRPVDQMGGPQTLLPTVATFQQADTPERLERFLARLHAYPAFMAANIELLSEGIASGLTAPRIVTERTIAQLERLLETPAAESVDRPDGPGRLRGRSGARPGRRPRRGRCRPTRPSSTPCAATTWPPAARTRACGRRPTATRSTGPRSWPGRPWPSSPPMSTRSASTSSSRSRPSARVIARSQGFGDDTAAYRAHLAADPANIPRLRRRAARPGPRGHRAGDGPRPALLRHAAAGRLRGPGRSRSTRRRTARSPTTSRRPPTARARASTTPTPTTSPSRTYSKLASTTYHEAVPGHHFQIAMEMENERLSTFRRLGSRMVGGAYVEGWGLYSERLADEMGLFRNEAERFGMLDAMAWRAARLVVDTGLHALRWPRQRSIDFLRGAGLSETDAVHRDGPLHLLAGPGADLQDRPARDRAAAGRDRDARRLGVRPARASTTRSSATARCRWRRSPASCRPGWPRRPDRPGRWTPPAGCARSPGGARPGPGGRLVRRDRPGSGCRRSAPVGPPRWSIRKSAQPGQPVLRRPRGAACSHRPGPDQGRAPRSTSSRATRLVAGGDRAVERLDAERARRPGVRVGAPVEELLGERAARPKNAARWRAVKPSAERWSIGSASGSIKQLGEPAAGRRRSRPRSDRGPGWPRGSDRGSPAGGGRPPRSRADRPPASLAPARYGRSVRSRSTAARSPDRIAPNRSSVAVTRARYQRRAPPDRARAIDHGGVDRVGIVGG